MLSPDEGGRWSAAEVRELTRALARGETALCPRCGTPVTRTPVPPREGVAYVRDRIWLTCGGCRRSVVLDRRAVEREGGG